jgi:hypothetical protein
MILDNLPEGSLWTKVKSVLFIEMDIIGGFLLLSSSVLFFIPFTITARSSPNKWGDASTIVMVMIGFFLLVVFCQWCYFTQFFPWFKTRLPFIPIRSFKNHTILIAFLMVTLDNCENACFNVYFSTTLQVGGYLGAGEAAPVNDVKKVSVDIASILTGLMMKYTKRSKIFILTGVPLLILGHGLLVWFMNRDGVMESSFLLTVLEVFTGVGRGMYSTALQVIVQAIAAVSSVAMSTAFFLTFNSVGTLIGTSIAGGIWSEIAINKLRENLPSEAQNNATTIFKNIKFALLLQGRNTG